MGPFAWRPPKWVGDVANANNKRRARRRAYTHERRARHVAICLVWRSQALPEPFCRIAHDRPFPRASTRSSSSVPRGNSRSVVTSSWSFTEGNLVRKTACAPGSISQSNSVVWPARPRPSSKPPMPANRPTVFIGAREDTTDLERGASNGSAVCRVRLASIRQLVSLDVRAVKAFLWVRRDTRI